MHELPIVQALVKQVIHAAQQQHAHRVTAVHISLGEFSGFVDDSVEFYWPLATQDTIAAAATLHIHRQPGQIKCLKCGHLFRQVVDLCPKCHSFKLQVVAGGDYQLDSIEIE